MLNDNSIEVDMQGMQFKRCEMCHLFKILQVFVVQPSSIKVL